MPLKYGLQSTLFAAVLVDEAAETLALETFCLSVGRNTALHDERLAILPGVPWLASTIVVKRDARTSRGLALLDLPLSRVIPARSRP